MPSPDDRIPPGDRDSRNDGGPSPANPSPDERERFSRQLGLPGWGDAAQERLRGARVFIAGAGGLGSAVALYLTAAGVGRITLTDPDVIELSNLNRQVLYATRDIGRDKVSTASERLTALDPSAAITPVRERLDDTNAEQLVRGHDLAIDCLDTLAARFVLNRASQTLRIPMVYGAVAGFTGHVSLFVPGRTPCLECFVPHKEPPAPAPVLGCTAGLIGTIQATEAIKHLTGLGGTLAGDLLIIDSLNLRFERLGIDRAPDCPTCAGA